MSMSKHANTVDTLPKNRYLNNLQNYHLGSPTEVTVVRHDDTFMHEIESLGISAGELQIEDVSVGVEGYIAIPRVTYVVHDPDWGHRGRINVYTDNDQ